MAFEGFVFGRHTIRTTDARTGESVRSESERYPGISPEGVELAREKAKEIQEIVDSAPKNAILFLGGSTEEERTKSTLEVYGDRLHELYAGSDSVEVMTRDEMDALRAHPEAKTVETVQKFIETNPEKKLVITYPLFLKEFSLRPEFRDKKTGVNTAFSKYLFEKGKTEAGATQVLHDQGGPTSAQEIALKHLEGVRRLRDFAAKYAGDRPVIIGFVGHAWILDSLASYLANDGQATAEAFDKTGGKMMESSELAKVELKNGGATFTYRDKKYEIPSDLLNL